MSVQTRLYINIPGALPFTLLSLSMANRYRGNQTLYLKNVLEFLRSYQLSFQATTEFCRKIQELDILTDMQANVTFATGETNRLTGFQGVDREKLRELSDDSVLELHKSGGLDALHAHLLSMQNFRLIADRIQPEAETNAAADVTDPVDETPLEEAQVE